MACLSLCFWVPVAWAEPQLTRGPYLQLGTPSSIVIRWRTDLATESVVRYGTNLAVLSQTNILEAPVTEHEAQLTGLRPGTRFFYSVGTSTTNLAVGSDQYFITAPMPGMPKPTRIWVVGDVGLATIEQAGMRDAYYRLSGTNYTDFWLQLGDNGYWGGTDSDYQAGMFIPLASLLRTSVTWPAVGNHDTGLVVTDSTNLPYFASFTLPTHGEAGGRPSGTERYYSFDHANVHLICLDSYTTDRSPTGAMALWLQADLQANTNPWVIAYWHHAPYSRGSHDSDGDLEMTEMRRTFLPILEAGGADLVLGGHSHSYERSYLLNGHYGGSWTLTPDMIVDAGSGRVEETGAYLKPLGCRVPNGGTVYAVVGCSSWLGGGTFDHPVMLIGTNAFGSLALEVSGNRLDAIFLRENGATNDHFTIIKPEHVPVADDLSLQVYPHRPTQLALTGADADGYAIRFAIASLPAHGLLSAFDAGSGSGSYTPSRGFAGTDSFSFYVRNRVMRSAPATVTLTVTSPVDTNQNGLDDAWELANGLSDPAEDADLDGMSNLAEYLAGTDPWNRQSRLRILSFAGDCVSGFTLVWSSVGGVRYRVEFGDGNAAGGFDGRFTPIVRPVAAEMDPAPGGTPGAMSYTDDFTLTGPPQRRARYYRVEVVP